MNNFFGGFDAPAFTIDNPTPRPQPTSKKKKGRGGTLTSLISEGGALGGAAAGAAAGSVVPGIGTAIGGLIGAGVGAFGGRLAENKVRDDRLGVKDAAIEGGLTAALGAPIRALKYGTKAAGALKGGDKLSDALKTGAQAADAPKQAGALRTKVGGALAQKSNDLLVKEFGLTPTQLTNFKNKYGEDATSAVRRHKLTGKNSDEIQQTVLQPLQDQFDLIPQSLPAVSRQSVESSFKTKYAPLLNSAVEDNKVIGRQLKGQSDSILKKYGDTIDATELNSIRKEFDSLVSYADKQANPARYGVNKRAADALRTVLQKEADRAGIASPSGQTFKEVGQELSKLRQLTDNIARQENNGRGSKPAGLINMLGGVLATGVTGDPLSAVGGIAATQALNSPTGRRALAKGSEKLASRVSNPKGGATSGLKIGATGVAAGGLLGALGGQSLSKNSDSTNANVTMPAPASNANMDQSYTNGGDLSSALAAQTSRYPFENAIADIKRDPENADYYMQLYEFSNPKQEEGNGLNSNTANLVASSANATNTLDQLESLFSTAGGGSGKIGGAFKNALAGAGLEGNTQTYNDLSASSVSQLARALNGGGQVSDADAAVVVQALPKITDSPAVAARKFAALRERLAASRQNTLLFNSGATPSGGGLESALAQ